MIEILEQLKSKYENNDHLVVNCFDWLAQTKATGNEKNIRMAEDIIKSAQRSVYKEIHDKLRSLIVKNYDRKKEYSDIVSEKLGS